MDEIFLMLSLAAFTLVAGLCSIVFNRLKMPPLIGYLVAGIILANFWHVTEDGEHIIKILADMGLVLLMFCIGLEINLKKLRKQGMFAIIVCMVQMPIILIGGFIAGELIGMNLVQSLALGAIMSGSSTAVVMAVLKSQNYLDRDHNESIILVLIIEDIGQVILLSILAPMMSGSSMDPDALIIMILSIVIFMAGAIFIGLRLLPPFINWISDNVSREVTIILVLGLTFSMAYLSILVGLSMAIGAFLMGMIVASARKSREIHHSIEPMENLFMAMFFISVGMEVSVVAMVDNIVMTLGILVIFLVLKILAVYLGYFVANEKGKICFLSAVSLTVMGEFAFIIAKEALDLSVISQEFYTAIVGSALLSMVLLPIIAKFAERAYDTADSKCPSVIKKQFGKVVARRDNFYHSMMMSSAKSRKAIRRSMAYAYMNVLFIVIIQAIFFFCVDPLAHWLVDRLGLTYDHWVMILMVLNFMLLFIPAHQLVSNVKFLDSAVVRGSKILSKNNNRSHLFYQSALEFNSIAAAFTIVALIIAIVPNPLHTWEHAYLFAVAAGVLLFLWFLSYLKKRTEKQNKALGFDVDEEEAPESEEKEEKPPEPAEEAPNKKVSIDVRNVGTLEKHRISSDEDYEVEIFIRSDDGKFRSHLRQSDSQTSSDSDRTASVSRDTISESSTTISPWHMTVFTFRLLPE